MKNQSTSVKSVNYDQEIKNWAEEDVLQLANHFHKLNGKQYERTHDFAFRAEDRVKELARFNTVKETMKSLKIYLALDENDKMKHTFFPVLKVIDGDGKEHSFKLYPVLERKVDHGESEVVPQVFKNMICKNWDEVDIHLIDDLFTARQKKEKQPEITVRVEYYDICKEIIDTEIKPIDTITGITLYSGIDMNKFADKYQISFTPVLGLKRENPKTPNPIMGLKGVVEFSKGEVLIEYSSPCPPTC